jgi:hypothetical protein
MRPFTMMALAAFGAVVATVQAESQTARPSQAASGAHSTCTRWMNSVCLSHRTGPPWSRQVSEAPLAFFSRPYQEKYCNFKWEQCMQAGSWNGRLAERR